MIEEYNHQASMLHRIFDGLFLLGFMGVNDAMAETLNNWIDGFNRPREGLTEKEKQYWEIARKLIELGRHKP